MLAASVLTVSSGVILKEGGQASTLWLAGVAILAASVVNVVRLIVWRTAHRLYPLSLTYPLTGLSFPMVLAVSAWYDEPVGLTQVMAVVLIAVGVSFIHRSGNGSTGDRNGETEWSGTLE
jgi:drug/metabolite transporter (DMT)-like permease